MSSDILRQLKKIEKRRENILIKLLSQKEMVRGTFCRIYVKCGKKGCKCCKGELHPHDRMSWRDQGKSFSRAVPKDDHEWITEMTNCFREFRKAKRELVKLHNQIQELVDQYERAVVDQTIKGRPYLEVEMHDLGGSKTTHRRQDKKR